MPHCLLFKSRQQEFDVIWRHMYARLSVPEAQMDNCVGRYGSCCISTFCVFHGQYSWGVGPMLNHFMVYCSPDNNRCFVQVCTGMVMCCIAYLLVPSYLLLTLHLNYLKAKCMVREACLNQTSQTQPTSPAVLHTVQWSVEIYVWVCLVAVLVACMVWWDFSY